MKTFELLKEEAEILHEVILHAPMGGNGYTIGDNRAALKVADRVEPVVASGGEIQLEDAEHAWLASRIQQQTWVVASLNIVNLVDKIVGATVKTS